MDPIARLAQIIGTGPAPFDWIVEHSDQATVDRAWRKSKDIADKVRVAFFAGLRGAGDYRRLTGAFLEAVEGMAVVGSYESRSAIWTRVARAALERYASGGALGDVPPVQLVRGSTAATLNWACYSAVNAIEYDAPGHFEEAFRRAAGPRFGRFGAVMRALDAIPPRIEDLTRGKDG